MPVDHARTAPDDRPYEQRGFNAIDKGLLTNFVHSSADYLEAALPMYTISEV
jgi:hypothetical protein